MFVGDIPVEYISVHGSTVERARVEFISADGAHVVEFPVDPNHAGVIPVVKFATEEETGQLFTNGLEPTGPETEEPSFYDYIPTAHHFPHDNSKQGGWLCLFPKHDYMAKSEKPCRDVSRKVCDGLCTGQQIEVRSENKPDLLDRFWIKWGCPQCPGGRYPWTTPTMKIVFSNEARDLPATAAPITAPVAPSDAATRTMNQGGRDGLSSALIHSLLEALAVASADPACTNIVIPTGIDLPPVNKTLPSTKNASSPDDGCGCIKGRRIDSATHHTASSSPDDGCGCIKE
jgi:hypothetical protein